jgi:hypothetical protein
VPSFFSPPRFIEGTPSGDGAGHEHQQVSALLSFLLVMMVGDMLFFGSLPGLSSLLAAQSLASGNFGGERASSPYLDSMEAVWGGPSSS